jgi:hypothetical protein
VIENWPGGGGNIGTEARAMSRMKSKFSFS